MLRGEAKKIVDTLNEEVAKVAVVSTLYPSPFLFILLWKGSSKVAPHHLGAVAKKLVGKQIKYIRYQEQLLTPNS